jgi:hypothetical protein
MLDISSLKESLIITKKMSEFVMKKENKKGD